MPRYNKMLFKMCFNFKSNCKQKAFIPVLMARLKTRQEVYQSEVRRDGVFNFRFLIFHVLLTFYKVFLREIILEFS